MGTVDLRRFSSPAELADTAAKDWLGEVQRTRQSGKPYTAALAGGGIAGKFFQAVAASAKRTPADFGHVQFFWSDERCVGPTDLESNYRLAYENMLRPLAIPEAQVHRIRGEQPPETAAKLAESELRQWTVPRSDGQPVVDLVFLGLGQNGHVASLFPEEPPALRTSPTVFRPVVATKPPPRRITMGYAAIAAARTVWVLVAGEGKERAFAESLSPTGTTPLAQVIQSRVSTRIYTAVV